jgi:hypothetical protein
LSKLFRKAGEPGLIHPRRRVLPGNATV